jgi:Pyruvate/2-oxoglutarate dehydrogenase complex, dehydrogenase (E1) component, eukaryotic type, alpha subunit
LKFIKQLKILNQKNKPAFVEAVIYRLTPHTTDEDYSRYLNPEVVKTWNEKFDPLKKFENYLREKEILNDEIMEDYKSQINEEIENALNKAERQEILKIEELKVFY